MPPLEDLAASPCPPPAEVPSPIAKRHTALDGLRGAAILWVMGYHLLTVNGVHPDLAAVPLLEPFLRLGWIGVAIFFALSGYLITQKLIEDRGQPGYFRRFLIRRSTRILPAYALLLMVMPLAAQFWSAERSESVFNGQIPFWSHFLFVQNGFMATSGYLGNQWLRVSWSLAIEVQYYVLAAILIHLVPVRRLGFVLLLIPLLALAFRYCAFTYAGQPSAVLMVSTLSRMDSFAMGGLVALAARSADVRTRGIMTVAILLVGSGLFLTFAQGAFGRFSYSLVPAYHTFLAAASAALVSIGVNSSKAAKFLSWPALREAGRLSYFLYLFHMPVLWIVFELLLGRAPEASSIVGLVLTGASAAAVWLLAMLSFRLLEEPAIRLGRKWTVARPARCAPTQAIAGH